MIRFPSLLSIKSQKLANFLIPKCVCGVYRAHIVQAFTRYSGRSPVAVVSSLSPNPEDIFIDHIPGNDIPSLDDVICFYQDFYSRSQMEHDTIIMSLIYVERLIKEDTGIVPKIENWRSVLFSCMVLASKVWDDLSMWNIDFSNVCGRGAGLSAYTLRRINELELALLKALKFNVKVPASEYAKYYFLIRTMLLKSGLLSTDEKPMNICSQEKVSRRSTKSMSDYDFVLLDQKACLEQLLSLTTY
jgi:Cyclin, N-terminal domain